MAVVLIPLFVTVMAGLAVVLIPGLEQRISADIADINGSFVKGVTGPIIQAWEVVAVIGAVLGLGLWFTEFEIGKKTGQEVPLPPVQPIALPAAPTFGSASGFRAGPFTTGIQAGSGGQAPPPVVYSQPGPSFAQQVAAARPAPPPPPAPQQGGGGRRGGRGRRQPGSLRATVSP